MENIKKYTQIIFKGLVLLLAILFLLKNCSGCLDKVVTVNDTLTVKQTAIVKDIHKSDSSLIQVIERTKQDSIDMAKAYEKLKLRYLKAIRQAPDTCRSYIDTVYGDALIIDLTDSIAIARQDTIIRLLSDQVKLYQKVTHNDTTRITQLSDSLRTERKSKKKYWKGVLHGAIGYGVLREAVNVYQIVKP